MLAMMKAGELRLRIRAHCLSPSRLISFGSVITEERLSQACLALRTPTLRLRELRAEME